MRVVGIASFMNSAGAQTALIRLMESLSARGHEAETWFFYEKQPAFRGKANVRSFFEKPHLAPHEYLQLLPMTVDRLKKFSPDAVITFLPLACVIGQAAAKLRGVRIRVASQRTPPSKHGRAMALLDKLLGSSGGYTRNICVSRAVYEEFKSYPLSYRRALAIVHNGIAWRGSVLRREQARESFAIEPSDIALVSTGRLNPQKNFPFMLEILAKTPGLRLLIAGDGPLRKDLETRAAGLGVLERVVFLGLLTSDRVADLLRAGDIFIQTSTYEGQSNSLLEAMAEGMAIVAGDIPMHRETVRLRDGCDCAVLLPLTDTRPWTTTLNRLAVNPPERAKLGEAARVHVEANFTLSAMVDGFEEILLTGPER